ncbi:MAG TPA: cytochrome c-type biogenesis protein CcmH, partial [Nocardioidaceae bacterium]|nr:cytochrome c-type biogenesis protein CcmH [Nocardioidaceae bacterium]
PSRRGAAMSILRRVRPGALLIAALLVALAALVVVALTGRSTPATPQQKAHEIAAGLHCPVCKDLSAADSPAPLARQMREQIGQQLAAGRTAGQIRRGFVAAYGPTVLMSPPDEGWGKVVHLAPLFVLVGGLTLGGALLRRALRRRPEVEDAVPSRDAVVRQIDDLDDDLADGRIGERDHRRLRAELERQAARATQRTEVVNPIPPVRSRSGRWTRRGLGIGVATAAAVGVTALLLGAVEQRTPAATAATAAPDAGTSPARPAANRADAQRLAEVEAALNQVKSHPRQTAAHIELARAYTGVRQPQLAAVEYLAATQLDPGNAEANTALSLVAFKAGNARQADALVSKALAKHPAYPEALYTRGLIRAMGLHHSAAATRDLRAYLHAAPMGSHRTTVATVLALLASKAIR